MPKSKETRITHDEILASAESRIAGADEVRLDHLEGLERVQLGRGAALEREARRLAAKHGDRDPRAAEMRQRAEAHAVLRHGLRMEVQRSSIDVPKAEDGAWIVFGFVRGAGDAERKRLLVVLADENGRVVDEAGRAVAGKDGAYRLRLAIEKRPRRKPDADDKDKAKAAADKDARARGPAFHLEVYRDEKHRIIADDLALRPAPGVVDYREIVLAKHGK
jgi:hypothetical protein